MNSEEIYKIAVSTRQFEIQMFWQRSNYFLVLNTALAVGFFSLRDSLYALLLAVVGIVVCLIWCLVNFGSKYWQSRWEEAASRLENQCAPEAKLFAATGDESHEEVTRSLAKANHTRFQKLLDVQILKKPSVSHQMTCLSLFFVLLWAIILCVSVFTVKSGATQQGSPANRPTADTAGDQNGQNTSRGLAITISPSPYSVMLSVAQTVGVICALSFTAYQVYSHKREQMFRNYADTATTAIDLAKMAVGNKDLHALYEYSSEEIAKDYEELTRADKAIVHYCDLIIYLCETVWLAHTHRCLAKDEWPYWKKWIDQLKQSRHFRWTANWVKDDYDPEFIAILRAGADTGSSSSAGNTVG